MREGTGSRKPQPGQDQGSGPDERVEEILAAACRVIVRRGFHATRIADIAQEAGTSTGTVHYHFETKEDVLHAALRWANTRPYGPIDEALRAGDNDTARLARLLEFAVPYPGRPRDEYVLLIELWGRILREPDLVRDGERLSARWRGYFFDIVRRGTENGTFRPVADPDVVAERLIALVDGLGFKAVLGYRWMSPERMRSLIYGFAAEQLGLEGGELARQSDRRQGRFTAPSGSRPSSTARTESTGRW
jgi:AcrR family transcriptional regulator